jgi:hypothetical protein
VTDAERAALALLVWCGFCWAAPGTACTSQGHHLARYLRAFRRGLVSRENIASVCRSLPAASAGQVVADVPAPGGAGSGEVTRGAAAGIGDSPA